MKFHRLVFSLSCLLIMSIANALPKNFVYLKDIDRTILQEVRYHSAENFLGRPVQGYNQSTCILTLQCARALAAIQKQLRPKLLSLKVFDCYRPQRAVDDFIEWSKDSSDQKTKAAYYPNIDKADLFKLNYIAALSSHSRGSTVDLTIINKVGKNYLELDMGTPWDYLDSLSHYANKSINKAAQQNRAFLRNLMLGAGFKGIKEEWWHFTLKDEPFPATYFNFIVE